MCLLIDKEVRLHNAHCTDRRPGLFFLPRKNSLSPKINSSSGLPVAGAWHEPNIKQYTKLCFNSSEWGVSWNTIQILVYFDIPQIFYSNIQNTNKTWLCIRKEEAVGWLKCINLNSKQRIRTKIFRQTNLFLPRSCIFVAITSKRENRIWKGI